MAMACHGHGEMRMALTAWRSPARPLMPALALGDSSHATPMPDLAELHWYVWCPWNVYQYVYKYDYYQCIYIYMYIINVYYIYLPNYILYIYMKIIFNKNMWENVGITLWHPPAYKSLKANQTQANQKNMFGCLPKVKSWPYYHNSIYYHNNPQ